MVEDPKDFWNKLDNRNDSSGSIGQSNFCELNEDMEESDKAPEKINLEQYLWIILAFHLTLEVCRSS